MTTCPTCHQPLPDPPPEPPIGTWVRDRFGGTSMRQATGWAEPGFVPLGRWDAMWHARGPLEICGPWGAEITVIPEGFMDGPPLALDRLHRAQRLTERENP